MLRNYLTTAIHNLVRHRLYSAINIGGLAVGLAACLLIVSLVRHELSFECFWPNAERIAMLETTFTLPGREPMAFASTPGPLKEPLALDFSTDIEHVVRSYRADETVRVGEQPFAEKVHYVDAGFFQVFPFVPVRGDPSAVMTDRGGIAVSERIAAKYFGDASALGQVIGIASLDHERIDYTIVGVFADLPANTHLDCDLVALFDAEAYVNRPWITESWVSVNLQTYVQFRAAESMTRVATELPAFVDRRIDLVPPGFVGKTHDIVAFNVMPLLDVHLYARKLGNFKPPGDIAIVFAFSAIALLILVIACINFVNLATARSMQRAREVAVRKVVGATRRQLVLQHLGEALLTTMVALLLGLALVELALGPYNAFLGKQLTFDPARDPLLAGTALGLVAFVGVLGGLYPAFVLSRFRPVQVLKANQSSVGGSPTLRNALVVFQFAISIALIVCTSVIQAQTTFARTIELGYQAGHKLVVNDVGHDVEATLKREIAALPGVRMAALASDAPPLEGNNNTELVRSPATDEPGILIETLVVDVDFFRLYGVRPLAGRLFSREFSTDFPHVPEDSGQDATQSIIVNRTFLSRIGVTDPEQAIGVVLWNDMSGPKEHTRMVRTTIVGVVPDLHLRSIRDEMTPLLYYVQSDEGSSAAELRGAEAYRDAFRSFRTLSVDVEPGRMPEVRAAVEAVWQRLVPGVPVRIELVDEDLAALYDAEEQRAQTFAAFAVLAIVIACLGLFGLASFAAERRTKEIGLRKVLGAGTFDLVRLLVWQFSRPVIVANAIAWPIAFYFMDRWLAGFRHAIDLRSPAIMLGVFGGAGALALAIAWATVAGHALKVARRSPIHALRCE